MKFKRQEGTKSTGRRAARRDAEQWLTMSATCERIEMAPQRR